MNPYAYAGSNPVMNTDPSGLASVGQILDDSAMRAASLNNTLQLAALSFAKVTWDVFGAENISRWADGQITSRIGLGIETAAAIPFVGPIAKLSKVASVSKYEVGTFDVLKGRSIVGDGLDIHHAMQKNPAGQVVPNYNPLSAPSIALPRAEHAMIPTLRGPYTGSARSLLAKDIMDMRNYTNVPNSSLIELIKLNKQMYPAAFIK